MTAHQPTTILLAVTEDQYALLLAAIRDSANSHDFHKPELTATLDELHTHLTDQHPTP